MAAQGGVFLGSQRAAPVSAILFEVFDGLPRGVFLKLSRGDVQESADANGGKKKDEAGPASVDMPSADEPGGVGQEDVGEDE